MAFANLPAFAIEGPKDIVARSDAAIRRNAERLTFPRTASLRSQRVAIPALDPDAQTRFAVEIIDKRSFGLRTLNARDAERLFH